MRKLGVIVAIIISSSLFLSAPTSATDIEVPVISSWALPEEIHQLLEDLSGSQSEATIQDAMESGKAVQVLVNSDTAEFMSVIELDPTERVVTPFAISPVSPGCGTNTACIYSKNTWLGYVGTGTTGWAATNAPANDGQKLVATAGAFVRNIGQKNRALLMGTVEFSRGTHYNKHPASKTIGHWVVGYGYTPTGFRIADPAAGIAGYTNSAQKFFMTGPAWAAFVKNGIVA